MLFRSRAWRDFWLIESSAASSAWLMRKAVRIARIQPGGGVVMFSALIGASSLSVARSALRWGGRLGMVRLSGLGMGLHLEVV